MEYAIDFLAPVATEPASESLCQGIVTLSFGLEEKSPKTFFTDWIDPGFGPGYHVIQTAVVSSDDPGDIPLALEQVFYGKAELFEELLDRGTSPKVQQGVLLDARSGKFRLALRQKGGLSGHTLRILWSAVRGASLDTPYNITKTTELPSENPPEPLEPSEPIDIPFYIENPPKRLHPGWRYTLRVSEAALQSLAKSQGKPAAIHWSLHRDGAEDKTHTGTIDAHGEFTAPEVPGVVEVTARAEGTDLSATAYLIITQ